jgi:hypothetical protein
MTPAWLPALALALAAAPGAPAPDGIDSLAWLAGHWEWSGPDRRVEELWLPPAGGMLLALHRDVRDGKPAHFEYLRIEAREDGIFYVASPGGRPPTDFRLVAREPARVVFENPAHDFPQRIEYRLDGDELVALVGTLDPSARTEEWRWRRVK